MFCSIISNESSNEISYFSSVLLAFNGFNWSWVGFGVAHQ
jgi:hypothetical protein